MTSLGFRSATADDAERVALLHADSWRRHYRGAYADSFLDGDIESDRREVWAKRLAAPTGTATILAEYDDQLAGFVHVEFDKDPQWGSLVDNLHVYTSQRRTGIGTQLLARAAPSRRRPGERQRDVLVGAAAEHQRAALLPGIRRY